MSHRMFVKLNYEVFNVSKCNSKCVISGFIFERE